MNEPPAKLPFDIDEVIRRIRRAVRPFRPAAMFGLAAEGFDSPFEQLAGCILSIRTRDETTVILARKLFAAARTASQMHRLGVDRITELIRGSTFYEAKGQTLYTIAGRIIEQFGGALPCDEKVLLDLPGVGPKCAHLVLGIACGQPHISVDIHVHRITNRWGYIRAVSPEKTMMALERVLPKRYWVEINRLLVPFGKHICTGASPRCSTCPILRYCRQVEVTKHR